MLTKEQKATAIEELTTKFKDAKGMVFASYQGLTVPEIGEMRSKLQEHGVEFKVYKNTLMNIAAKRNGIENLESIFKGSTAVAISNTDEVAPAKELAAYLKTLKSLALKGGVIEGKAISIEQVQALAELPGKDVLLAKLCGTCNAPLVNFLSVSNAPMRAFLQALSQIAKQKEAN